MTRGLVARVWPSRPALDRALALEASQALGGLFLVPPWYTLESLLPKILEQTPLPPGWAPLHELAGPLLVQGLLVSEGADMYSGLAAGRRLPRGLWRLLVEVKAAGLGSRDLRDLAGGDRPRLLALADLLARYQSALRDLRLADQADRLAELEKMLAQGRRPPLLARWAGLEMTDALWLRPLDIRLLRMLAQVMPVRVEFCLTPERDSPASLRGLLAASEKALMRGAPQGLDLAWRDIAQPERPLASLVGRLLDPGGDPAPRPEPNLEIMRAPGCYPEVEALAERALELLEGGLEPSDLALVFPDLGLYGQMTLDAARRLGLPVNLSQGAPLGDAPPVRALLDLLELPLLGYPRPETARVLESPYLCGIWGGEPEREVESRLARAGYIDAREEPPERRLTRGGRENGLVAPVQKLYKLLEEITQHKKIIDYICSVRGLVAAMQTPEPDPARDPDGAIWSRDRAARAAALQALDDLESAARQVESLAAGAGAPGRLLALLRETLDQTTMRGASGRPGGIPVLRLDQTLGLELHTVLVGGLNQGRFPVRPQGRHLLSARDRMALGRRAGMPVWRTEEEEYGGQVLRLLRLMASVRGGAALSCAGADQGGREQSPSALLVEISRLGCRELAAPKGGVYGDLPPLERCRDHLGLWGRLAAELLRPGSSDPQLARAVLFAALQRPGAGEIWRDLAARARVEQDRLDLDRLGLDQRRERSGPFSGRMASPPARELLAAILAQPEQRRISPSSLESYVACPLAWFCGYILGLAEPEAPGWDMERREEGQWVHKTLAAFFDPQEYDPGWTPEQRARRLAGRLDRAEAELAALGSAGHDQVRRARRKVLEAALGRVVEQEAAVLAGMRPAAVEADLGPQGQGLAVPLDSGEPLTLIGRLDRLDLGDGVVRVTDYKHTSNDATLRDGAKPENLGNSAFQLPVYLAGALASHGSKAEARGRLISTLVPEAKPGEAVYEPGHGFLSPDPQVRRDLAARSEPNLFNAIAQIWQGLEGGDFIPRPEEKKCDYCGFSQFCRARFSPLAQED